MEQIGELDDEHVCRQHQSNCVRFNYCSKSGLYYWKKWVTDGSAVYKSKFQIKKENNNNTCIEAFPFSLLFLCRQLKVLLSPAALAVCHQGVSLWEGNLMGWFASKSSGGGGGSPAQPLCLPCATHLPLNSYLLPSAWKLRDHFSHLNESHSTT